MLTLFAAVYELSSVHTLSSDEKLRGLSEFVRMTEDNSSEGGATARVVKDFLDYSLDESMSFSEIQGSVLGSSLSAVNVTLKHRARTLSLC